MIEKVSSEKYEKIVIIGAGISGLSIGIFLARAGYDVEVYEKSSDPRRTTLSKSSGRSINFTLSQRGLTSIKRLGIFDKIKATSSPLHGRVIHKINGCTQIQKYSLNGDTPLLSVKRKNLLNELLNCAEKNSIALFFNHRYEDISSDTNTIYLHDENNKKSKNVRGFEFVIGADGSFSKVKYAVHRKKPSKFTQKYLEFFYKEILLAKNNKLSLNTNFLHVWPLKNGVVVGMPNKDHSLTINIILDVTNKVNFNNLSTIEDFHNLFKEQAPELLKMSSQNFSELTRNGAHAIVENRTDRWYYKNKIVLIGDACHAVSPFLGQGMNSALEDADILSTLILENKQDVEIAFEKFQNIRKQDTDLLAKFSYEHLKCLGNNNIFSNLKGDLDFLLQRVLGKKWAPLYTLIAHTNERYSDIYKRTRIQAPIKAIIIVLYCLGYPLRYFTKKELFSKNKE